MNILVLGGNGFIGSHLVDELLNHGHSVRVFDKFEELYRRPLAEVDYQFGDFDDRGALKKSLIGIDIVFHLITTTLPKTSNDDPIFDVTSNLVETIALLEQCVEQKIKKFVFASSGGTIYGKSSAPPFKEESPTNPGCSYGIVKLAIEKYLQLFYDLHGLNYSVVRPSNPYGERQNPMGSQGVIPIFLGKILAGQEINIWGNGEIIRDYIYVSDLAKALYAAATINTKDKIFNVGSGHGYSLNFLIRKMECMTNIKAKVNYLKKRNFDIDEVYLDVGKAKSQLDWQPSVSLDVGIHRTILFLNPS